MLVIISLKFVPEGQINNILALVQIMAWRRPGDKPLSEQMMVDLLMNICVTRPQWVNEFGVDTVKLSSKRTFQKVNILYNKHCTPLTELGQDIFVKQVIY